MGIRATQYIMRKWWRRIAEVSEAEHELDYYFQPDALLWPRPCWCEWHALREKLLGNPPPPSIPCACAGPVCFNVPGYTGEGWGAGNVDQMRRFAQAVDRNSFPYQILHSNV